MRRWSNPDITIEPSCTHPNLAPLDITNEGSLVRIASVFASCMCCMCVTVHFAFISIKQPTLKLFPLIGRRSIHWLARFQQLSVVTQIICSNHKLCRPNDRQFVCVRARTFPISLDRPWLWCVRVSMCATALSPLSLIWHATYGFYALSIKCVFSLSNLSRCSIRLSNPW